MQPTQHKSDPELIALAEQTDCLAAVTPDRAIAVRLRQIAAEVRQIAGRDVARVAGRP